jgi:septal ring factor EnvC (AmiA/AmiB activator)
VEAEEIQRRIDDAEARLRDYTDREVTIISDLNDIDYAIDRAGRRISKNKRELAELEKKIQTTRQRYVELVETIEKNETYTAVRLVALYKMRALGSWQFLASSKSVFDMLRRKRYLEEILEQDDKIRTEFLRDKSDLKTVLDRLNGQQIEKRRIEESIKAHLDELAVKRTLRSRVLEDIRNKKSLQIAAVTSLKNAAEALDSQIQTLSKSSDPALEGITMQSFSELKGLLKRPVDGKIIHFYGPHKDTRFNVTVFRSGIDIQAPKDSPVHAVFAGRILYADWFKGYGNMIIIDHGDNYYTIYAHLQQIIAQKGDFVNTGEDIATLGETGSIVGPLLHFEVRHHGKPMDPMEWLVKK